MAGLITDYFSYASGAPSAAPDIPAGEWAFYQDADNHDLYLWGLDGTPTWALIASGGGVAGPDCYHAALGSDVASIGTTYVDVLSLTLPAGTWLITAQIVLSGVSTVHDSYARLYDGTNTLAAAEMTHVYKSTLVLATRVTLAGSTAIKLQASVDSSTATAKASFTGSQSQAGDKATQISAVAVTAA